MLSENEVSQRNRTGLANPQLESGDEIDLLALAMRLWKGKRLIAAASTLAVCVGAFVIANTQPTYQADALLQLEENSGSLAVPSSLSAIVADNPRSATEIEIVKSRMVLSRAIATQNLDWQVMPAKLPLIGTMLSRYHLPVLSAMVPSQFVRPGETLTLEQLVVPPHWVNQMIEVTILPEQAFQLTLPDSTVLTGKVGQMIAREPGFALTVAATNAPAGRQFMLTQVDETSAINNLRDRLSVSELSRMSGILEVRVTGTDRDSNARALDAVIQSYVHQNVMRSTAEAQSSLEFIRQQLPKAEDDLGRAESELDAFRQKQVTVDLPIETQTVLAQITRTEDELAALTRREDDLRQRYTPAHPSYKQLLDERARLQSRLEDLHKQVGALPETQRQIVNLTRSVDVAQGIYTELLTRSQEVEVLKASSIGNVRIVDVAASGRYPIAPRKGTILALSLLLGLVGGAALVLLRDALHKGIQDSSELEKLGLPVFATINYSKDADTKGGRGGVMPILAVTNPTDITVEALRSLRTNLHFGMLDARSPTLTVTSTHPGAGKSFLSANLAVVAAQAGQRVCLIDADLRRGQLRRHFELPRNQRGLAEVLAGDVDVQDVLLPTQTKGLSFLPTGRYPPNPSELLMRAELSSLVEWCAANFDLTIFDAPPILAVTDPVVLGRNTGASILVARHELTVLGEIEAAIKAFSAAGLRISGSVLNGFDPKKAKGGYGYGYGYGYRYEYRQRTSKHEE